MTEGRRGDRGGGCQGWGVRGSAVPIELRLTTLPIVSTDLPEVTMSLEPSLRIQEGEMVTFTCQAKANPAAVTWK